MNFTPLSAPLFRNDANHPRGKLRKLEFADDAIGNRSHDCYHNVHADCARRILLTIVNKENCAGAARRRAFIGYPYKFIE